jgi:hypothetical protein
MCHLKLFHLFVSMSSSSHFLFALILGSLKLVLILLLGVLGVASIIYCFWTTRRSGAGSEQVQRRLTNDNNLLNQSDFDVLVSVKMKNLL